MNAQLHDLFERCLTELQEGKTLQEVLEAHPQAQEELEPLLKLAMQTSADRNLDPTVDAIHRSRTKMLTKAAMVRASEQRSGVLGWFTRYAVGIAAALFILVSSYGLLSVSAESLPGDLLYPIKRSAENLRLGLTSETSEREFLEQSFKERRSEEVAELLLQGRIELVSFEGRVEEIGAQAWFVDDIRVLVNQNTQIIGEIHVDDEIEVEGETQTGGYVLAFELHKSLMTLAGRVDQIAPDYWEIEGRIAALTPESEIKDDISIGDFVIALLAVADDRSLSLVEVRLDDDMQDEQVPHSAPEPEVERVEFTGLVESIGSSSWIVAGRLVNIDGSTDIDEGIEIGDIVRVRAEQRGSTIWALDIDEREGDDGESEAEESEEPDEIDDEDSSTDDETSESDDEPEEPESDDEHEDDEEEKDDD